MFDSYSRSDPNLSDEQLLYAHLRSCVEVEPPSLAIERFRRLLIEGENYPNERIAQAIERILTSHWTEKEFHPLLNRSCYILINQWQNQPRHQAAVLDLIALLELVEPELVTSEIAQHLAYLLQEFKQTDSYKQLQAISQKIQQKLERSGQFIPQPTGQLIHRYPSLYEHCLIAPNPSNEQWYEVIAMRDRVQQQFEEDLSQYITAQSASKSLNAVKNPTLLSDDQLDFSIQKFTGKVDGVNTSRDLAEQFRSYSKGIRSYRMFKEELYEYLTDSHELTYGKGLFDRRLYQHLQAIRTQDNSQKPNETLLVGTCRKLLDFLVVESQQKPEHYIFGDLTANLGPGATIGLLMKIVLLCRQLKSYLEQRFAILFKHYESAAQSSVGWLVESLEHLNVAFSLNFGKLSNSKYVNSP
jgi:hypothetical protein